MNKTTIIPLDTLSLSAQPKTQFKYPDEDLPEDLKELVEEHIQKEVSLRTNEITRRLLILLLTHSNPATYLMSLCLATHIDLSFLISKGKPTYARLATLVHCTKQNLHKCTRHIRRQLSNTL